MTAPGHPYDFVYVHTDIPEGMAIGEWRKQRTPKRRQRRPAGRDEHRQRRTRALRRWRAALHAGVRRPRLRCHEAPR